MSSSSTLSERGRWPAVKLLGQMLTEIKIRFCVNLWHVCCGFTLGKDLWEFKQFDSSNSSCLLIFNQRKPLMIFTCNCECDFLYAVSSGKQ